MHADLIHDYLWAKASGHSDEATRLRKAAALCAANDVAERLRFLQGLPVAYHKNAWQLASSPSNTGPLVLKIDTFNGGEGLGVWGVDLFARLRLMADGADLAIISVLFDAISAVYWKLRDDKIWASRYSDDTGYLSPQEVIDRCVRSVSGCVVWRPQ